MRNTVMKKKTLEMKEMMLQDWRIPACKERQKRVIQKQMNLSSATLVIGFIFRGITVSSLTDNTIAGEYTRDFNTKIKENHNATSSVAS
jgi:hypothetical protein